MKIHTCFITHNRIELSRIAIESYLETVSVPYTYVVFDNASGDGTAEWLADQGHPCILWNVNRYPGFACNRGWELAPDDVTLYHRADNDFRFLPGWCEEIQRVLEFDPRIGQIGLRTWAEELGAESNVGGNCMIARALWDKGLRWEERPWQEYDPGLSEDLYMSVAVKKKGFRWKRVSGPCIEPLASGDWNDPYYAKSYGDRRIPRPQGV